MSLAAMQAIPWSNVAFLAVIISGLVAALWVVLHEA